MEKAAIVEAADELEEGVVVAGELVDGPGPGGDSGGVDWFGGGARQSRGDWGFWACSN